MGKKATITPNRSAQATQELKGIAINKIDFLINEGEATGYVYIGIKTKDSQDGMSKVHGATKLYAPTDMHNRMKKDVEVSKIVKGLFNGMYNKMIILHDPTMPMHVEEPKKKELKGLSPIQKSKVNAMMEAGQGSDDEGLKAIGKELNISFDRLKAYLKTF